MASLPLSEIVREGMGRLPKQLAEATVNSLDRHYGLKPKKKKKKKKRLGQGFSIKRVSEKGQPKVALPP